MIPKKVQLSAFKGTNIHKHYIVTKASIRVVLPVSRGVNHQSLLSMRKFWTFYWRTRLVYKQMGKSIISSSSNQWTTKLTIKAIQMRQKQRVLNPNSCSLTNNAVWRTFTRQTQIQQQIKLAICLKFHLNLQVHLLLLPFWFCCVSWWSLTKWWVTGYKMQNLRLYALNLSDTMKNGQSRRIFMLFSTFSLSASFDQFKKTVNSSLFTEKINSTTANVDCCTMK